MRGGAWVVAIGLLTIACVAPIASASSTETLLTVDDGEFFYDGRPDDEVCAGTTNDHTKGIALRHWHVGVPFGPREAEAAGGYGCLGGPTSWTVAVDEGHVAHVSGEVRYTWDKDVPGGGFNDVQIYITDSRGVRVYSTVEQDGPNPVNPVTPTVRSHTIDTTLGPGTYTIVEDIFSGEHTTWLTELTVTAQPADPGSGSP